jgi:class 3 adenylate cyclase
MTSEQHRLAAILVADVVGYSKLIGSDEAGTLAQLEACVRRSSSPTSPKHAGRLFKSVGDGFLLEFASNVQAVSSPRRYRRPTTRAACRCASASMSATSWSRVTT